MPAYDVTKMPNGWTWTWRIHPVDHIRWLVYKRVPDGLWVALDERPAVMRKGAYEAAHGHSTVREALATAILLYGD